jgi:hypothetical protein
MSTNATDRQERDAPSDDQLLQRATERTPLGVDEQGATHYHDAATGLIWVVHDGAVVQRSTISVRRWTTIVADQCGWTRLNLDERPTGAWLADVAREVA